MENNEHFTLEQYDLRYYIRLREEKLCSIDMEKIREYFPLDTVISGTLNIYQKLLGLKFIENTHSDVWDDNVKYFDVYDYTAATDTLGKKMGSFYLDLYQRDGKPSQPCALVVMTGCDVSKITGLENERRLSVAAMLCNFKKDDNLLFSNVVTIFHEFGHVMHFICSQTQLSAFHAQKMEVDFIETPSKMLENWCYEPSVLRYLSAHHDTHEPLPNEMAEKIKLKQKIHAGYARKQQLVYGFFDYLAHDLSLEELGSLDLKQFYHEIQSKVLSLPIISQACLPGYFAHLVHGYDVGYYGYMISDTYASDMYATVFSRDPMPPESGALYRKHILEPGASQDAMNLLEQFLGRKPRLDAFLEKSGLKEVSKRKLSYLFSEEIISKDIKTEKSVETTRRMGNY
jgi:Zn-dependent oligopeptidase